jgi:hypothetical protein
MTLDTMQILIAMGAYLLFSIGVGVWYAKKGNTGTEEFDKAGTTVF